MGATRLTGPAAGEAANSEAWAHTWRVVAPTETVVYFQAGESAAGDPLATWGNSQLECVIRRIAPAQTIVQFSYV